MQTNILEYLEGTVNINEGQLLFTTIPYEEGWTLKVDGKKADNLIIESTDENGTIRYSNDPSAESGKVIMLESTIGLKLPAGQHTITLKYTPPGFAMGIFTLILGIAIMVMFYLYDRKNNPVLIERQKEKERKKLGLENEEPAESNKKKNVQIIRSKGAVTEKELTPADNSDDEESLSENNEEQSEKNDKQEKSDNIVKPDSNNNNKNNNSNNNKKNNNSNKKKKKK